jgi:hypothetical protein
VARARKKTKKSNLTPKMLPGNIERRMVRCGKPNCKCAKGELHGPYYYHQTWSGTEHQRRYITLANVPEVTEACETYRQLQASLRVGREEYKQMMAQMRHLLRSLSI